MKFKGKLHGMKKIRLYFWGSLGLSSDYIKTKDKPTFDNIGNTTIIPTAVIVSIKKIN